MIKEITIQSNPDVSALPGQGKVCSKDLISLLSVLEKCQDNYCLVVEVVESRSYAIHQQKLHQIALLLEQLTKREAEVLQLVIQGLQNKRISEELNISIETVKSHRKKIVSKVGLQKVNDLMNILYMLFINKMLKPGDLPGPVV